MMEEMAVMSRESHDINAILRDEGIFGMDLYNDVK